MKQPAITTLLRHTSLALGALTLVAASGEWAAASELPAVKTGASSVVAACATPGRLMAFTRARNEKLDIRFEAIATEYMRHGEELSIRWDIAYFQMLVETGNLKFGGDVRASQNNFAGLGATGNGEHGESFKDISTGVRAHLEHLLMYAGEKVANPVAERTRKVQEWGVLTDWQKTIKGPMTFGQLAHKWAPSTRKYAAEIGSVADSFMDGLCKGDDPNPEMVAAARTGKPDAAAVAPVKAAAVVPASEDKVSGAELARRAVAEARDDGTGQRAALGAASVAKSATAPDPAAPSKPVQAALINPPKPEPEAEASPATGGGAAVNKVAAAGATKGAKPAADAAANPGACKVFTASYGGSKAVVIKAVTGQGIHYTVLDVNEGFEAREAEAYIEAYAPGGKQVGEFATEAKALDKAFDLCPEG